MDRLYNELTQIFSIHYVKLNLYGEIVLRIAIIIALSKISIILCNNFINKIFKFSPKLKLDEKKSSTLMGILKSIIKYLIYLIAGTTILNVLNFPTQSIIAAAGLGGIAFGFGAQSLVKDIVTGFFILLEDQYGVGDYVTIGSMTGTVEDIGLRVTKLRAYTGELHIIPNGGISIVTNLSRGNNLAIIDIGIAYEANEEKAMETVSKVAQQYYNENSDIVVKSPEMLGIISFGENDVVLRLIVYTAPLKHWMVERELRLRIKKAFEASNIEIPYPRRVIINK